MVEFDRKQELTRLRKKADDFKRRAERGTRMLGDDEELRDLLIGAGDLEKKTAKVRAILSLFSLQQITVYEFGGSRQIYTTPATVTNSKIVI